MVYFAAQVLFSVNSCINPFIYARTIPEFKEIVLKYICRPFKRNDNQRNQNETNEMTEELKANEK
jgi:hypothetical protein